MWAFSAVRVKHVLTATVHRKAFGSGPLARGALPGLPGHLSVVVVGAGAEDAEV